ncbi:hypothetical protein QJS10_CPB18g00802 [Acorus calamus]|uniref:Glycosyltransferase 61 catalytic domain-containing protein n=1 Tax=Acorus calamus TaxID=4465 RepID=A0AAV9CPQ0_ACOCL|nr:hypothetical protein QJS10_CPB18g00802 [Acorus calamus]
MFFFTTTMNEKPQRPNRRPKPPPSTVHFYVIAFLTIIALQSLAFHQSQTQTHHPQNYPHFHPLKDPTIPPYTHPNKTWFMSTLTATTTIPGMPEHLVFPSSKPTHRLCIDPHRKSYTISTTTNATVLTGLTFVADTYYDYSNPWHALNALSPFLAWGGCKLRPKRFVLFKRGDVGVVGVGGWVEGVMRAALGGGFRIDGLMGCKGWEYCGVGGDGGRREREGEVRIALVGREGMRRSFRNESGVRLVMERECGRIVGCSLKLIHFDNMSFCDQVREMRNSDILASIHGAQMTNMMFMPPGSGVMEMYPKGWLEGAGIGQYTYQWFANWSQMSYEGSWRDTDGPDCDHSQCFKDRQVGLNETFLAEWTRRVVRRHGCRKAQASAGGDVTKGCSCD